MPISEDEFEQISMNEPTSTMSKAELRKSHKPIMEKRRRARINQCLNEIKTLILEAMKKDPARHSKLEKADILEMAVKHLQNVQRQQLAMAMAGDPTVLRKFKTGFNECAREVSGYIFQLDEQTSGLRDRVGTHLTKCINSIEQIAQLNFPGLGSLPFLTNNVNIYTSNNKASEPTSTGDQNNNPRVQMPQSIQLIPSRLPTGELAFLLPNSNNLPDLSNLLAETKAQVNTGLKTNQRTSAFASVIASSAASQDKPLSPPLSPTGSNNSQDDVILVSQNFPRSPSPRGFRPVNPTLQKSYQSAFVSTAKLGRSIDLKIQTDYLRQDRNQSEVGCIKYSITNNTKKSVEPLCIITNNSERYKQAQVVQETINCEENRQGMKRKFEDSVEQSSGLLSVASREYLYPAKIVKTSSESYPGQYRNVICNLADKSVAQRDEKHIQPSTSQSTSQDNSDNVESSGDMWRPW